MCVFIIINTGVSLFLTVKPFKPRSDPVLENKSRVPPETRSQVFGYYFDFKPSRSVNTSCRTHFAHRIRVRDVHPAISIEAHAIVFACRVSERSSKKKTNK